MYILSTEALAVSESALSRAVEGLLTGNSGRSWRLRRRFEALGESFYEEYARRCIKVAFSDRVPTEVGSRLTEELLKRVWRAVYDFRWEASRFQLDGNEVLLECRWILEGYLGRPISTKLKASLWADMLDSPWEPSTKALPLRAAKPTFKPSPVRQKHPDPLTPRSIREWDRILDNYEAEVSNYHKKIYDAQRRAEEREGRLTNGYGKHNPERKPRFSY